MYDNKENERDNRIPIQLSRIRLCIHVHRLQSPELTANLSLIALSYQKIPYQSYASPILICEHMHASPHRKRMLGAHGDNVLAMCGRVDGIEIVIFRIAMPIVNIITWCGSLSVTPPKVY